MFRIDRDAYYTLEDLEAMFAANGTSARWFLDTVRPPKIARSLWLGSDILDASRDYSTQRVREHTPKVLPQTKRRGRPHEVEIEQIPMPTK